MECDSLNKYHERNILFCRVNYFLILRMQHLGISLNVIVAQIICYLSLFKDYGFEL
jgi:hypothetical protein